MDRTKDIIVSLLKISDIIKNKMYGDRKAVAIQIKKIADWMKESGAIGFDPVVADELPTPSESTTGQIYFIPAETFEENNGSDEYITVLEAGEYKWEKVGSTTIDIQQEVIDELLAIKGDVDGMMSRMPSKSGTLALQEDVDEKLLRKANVDGTYESMSVGTAQNLSGRKEVADGFFARPTGGEDAEVANGLAQNEAVGGNSVKFNQLVKNGNFADGTTGWTGITSLEDGIATMQAPATGSAFAKNLARGVSYIQGHTYIFFVLAKSNNAGTRLAIIPTGNASQGMSPYSYLQDWSLIPFIWTMTGASGVGNMQTCGYNSADPSLDVDFSVKSVMCTDLTDIFGAGNEPDTVAEYEAWLAENVGLSAYYAQTENTVINVNMKGLASIGRNLLDPSTGKATIIGAYSDVYGNYYGITGTHGAITFVNWAGESTVISPDTDGKFLIEEPGTLSVADAGEDCAVFFWWDGTKTDYVEYEKNVGNLDLTHIYGKKNGTGELVQVWPDGPGGVGDVKDVLRNEDGVAVARRRMGKVDMGTLSWTLISNETYLNRFGASYSDAAISGNSIVAGYNNVGIGGYGAAINADRSYSHQSNSAQFNFHDSRYLTAEAFATAVTGIPLYYELATEEVFTDLVYMGSDHFEDGTPVTLPVKYKVDNWGMEQILPVNDGAVLTAKPTVTTMYAIDAVELLNTHSDEIEDIYEKIDEKPNAVGTYPGMSVGSADTLNGDTAQHAEYTERNTGYPSTVASGLAKMTQVHGKSIVWNQKIKIPTSDKSTTQNGVTVVDNRNGSYTISTVPEGASAATTLNLFTLDATDGAALIGHRLYMRGAPNGISGVSIRALTFYDTGNGIIFSPPATLSGWPRLVVDAGTVITTPVTIWPELFDLTLTFGATSAAAMTVEQFERLYNLPYFAYNAGEIKNNAATAIESLDADGNVLSTIHLNLPTLTGKLNGEGESVVIYPDGMRDAGSGSAFDYLIVDADGYARTAVKACGSYSFRAADTWTVESSDHICSIPIPGMNTTDAADERIVGLVCSKYILSTGRTYSQMDDKSIMRRSGKLIIRDTALTTADVPSAMAGQELNYELATPEVYTLDEPIYMGYIVDGDGTERRLPVDTADSVLAPFSCDVIYAIDAVGTLKKLPENYISKESMQAYLTARAAIDNGVWTMTWNETTGKYDFTFTPNGE